MAIIETTRIVKAAPEAAWAVIRDHEGYAELTAAGISKVEVLEGDGAGMTRRCHNPRGESWEETCSLWEEGRAFEFTVDTTADDYPYPLKEVIGYWAVEPHPDGSQLRARFKFAMNPLMELMFRVTGGKRKALADTEVLMDNWEKQAAAL